MAEVEYLHGAVIDRRPPGPRELEPVARFGHRRTDWGMWWERHPRALRVLAVGTIAWGAAYLTWRVGWSLDRTTWQLGVPLLAAELVAFSSLVLLTVLSWQRPTSRRRRATPGLAVDVYVYVDDEPIDVLRATLTGARAIRYPHTTWVLGTRQRGDVAALTGELGATFLAPTEGTRSVTDAVNDAVQHTDGELLFLIAADQVPLPDALDALIGYFEDPVLAVVQTPPDFYNQDSVGHLVTGRHEQSLHFEVVLAGMDRLDAATWLGSAALVRRAAVREIGGVIDDISAGAMRTSLKLRAHGWSIRYHRETTTQGLAPHDLRAHIADHDRRARADLGSLRSDESPLRRDGLTRRQRWAHLGLLGRYAAAPARGLALVVLAAALWAGRMPLPATGTALIGVWMPTMLLLLAARSALARGHRTMRESLRADLTTMALHTRLMLRAIGRAHCAPRARRAGSGGQRWWGALAFAVTLDAALVTGVAARVVGTVGARGVPPLRGVAAWFVVAVGAVEAARVTSALGGLARHRQLRLDHRFGCREVARVNGHRGHVIELNRLGATLEIDTRADIGDVVAVHLDLPDTVGSAATVDATAVVRSLWRGSGDQRLGIEFLELGSEARQAITEFCYVVCATESVRGLPPHLLADAMLTAAGPLDPPGAGPVVKASPGRRPVSAELAGAVHFDCIDDSVRPVAT